MKFSFSTKGWHGRTFDEFSPVIAMGDNNGVNYENGVITYNGEGSVYAPCDGVVSGVIETENGKFEIEIKHSENFKTVISDIEHLYVAEGDKVYGKIPVMTNGYCYLGKSNKCYKDCDKKCDKNSKCIQRIRNRYNY